ncbi:unnamed protein product [Oncorhynchus mykiss]|uniref:Uncharacterized protein n=1 Tax=Oncorhynchus mykiss TaxID=8022 RepID=A0A060WJI1_ONCMY|nr:unnamed protein product [Oncorhynchus mykiss]
MWISELSTSILHYELKTDMTKSGNRRLYFDTHALVRLLEDNGFTTQQAEVIVRMMVRTTHSNMDLIYNDMVTKVQQVRLDFFISTYSI